MKRPGPQSKSKVTNQMNDQIQEQNKQQSTDMNHKSAPLNFKRTKPTSNGLASNDMSLQDQPTEIPISKTPATQSNSTTTKELPSFFPLTTLLHKYFKPAKEPTAQKLKNFTRAAHNKLALDVVNNLNLSPTLRAVLQKTTAFQDTKPVEKKSLPQNNSQTALTRLLANYALEGKLHVMFIFGVSDPKILNQLIRISQKRSQYTDLLLRAGRSLLELTKPNKNELSCQTQKRTPKFKRVEMVTTKPAN